MNLIDTHCHIHEDDYPIDREDSIELSRLAGVTKIICVGTDVESSNKSIEFASNHEKVWSVIGVHPHESKHGIDGLGGLVNNEKVVGIGEIGLDYYYNHSPRDVQIEMLNRQIEIAIRNDLPISFHVREAFDDFWPIIDNFGNSVKGVIHSFTDSTGNLDKALERGFMIGINGIVTFNKDPKQHQMYLRVPLSNMIFETDSPFLAPKPYRGKTNQPAFIKEIAAAISEMVHVDLDEVANITTSNAERLFNI